MILDIIVIALIVFAAFRGWRKGAVRIIGAFVILIAAILIASAFGTQFGRAIGVGPTLLHPVTGFFILFFILYIVGSFLRRFLTPKSGENYKGDNDDIKYHKADNFSFTIS